MGWEAFETATRRTDASHGHSTGALVRYRPQIAVSVLVVIVLVGAPAAAWHGATCGSTCHAV
jgi:hypothetical protein